MPFGTILEPQGRQNVETFRESFGKGLGRLTETALVDLWWPWGRLGQPMAKTEPGWLFYMVFVFGWEEKRRVRDFRGSP